MIPKYFSYILHLDQSFFCDSGIYYPDNLEYSQIKMDKTMLGVKNLIQNPEIA